VTNESKPEAGVMPWIVGIGALVVCCTIELLTVGGIGLGLFGWLNSRPILIAFGALIVCVGAGLFLYKSFKKDRDYHA
jgi:hypothetical protein